MTKSCRYLFGLPSTNLKEMKYASYCYIVIDIFRSTVGRVYVWFVKTSTAFYIIHLLMCAHSSLFPFPTNTLQESKPKETDTVSKQALNDLRKKTFAVASANMTKVE